MAKTDDPEVLERMAKARAARGVKAAALPMEDVADVEIPEDYVKVRILKLGDHRIFTGDMHETSLVNRFPTYARNEIAYMPMETAVMYEDRGWVEPMQSDAPAP